MPWERLFTRSHSPQLFQVPQARHLAPNVEQVARLELALVVRCAARSTARSAGGGRYGARGWLLHTVMDQRACARVCCAGRACQGCFGYDLPLTTFCSSRSPGRPARNTELTLQGGAGKAGAPDQLAQAQALPLGPARPGCRFQAPHNTPVAHHPKCSTCTASGMDMPGSAAAVRRLPPAEQEGAAASRVRCCAAAPPAPAAAGQGAGGAHRGGRAGVCGLSIRPPQSCCCCPRQ